MAHSLELAAYSIGYCRVPKRFRSLNRQLRKRKESSLEIHNCQEKNGLEIFQRALCPD